MNMVIFERLDGRKKSKIRLLSLITELDLTYIPPISSRTKLSKYCIKLIKFAEVIVAKQAEIDIGFAAVYANDKRQRYAFLTSIGVKSEYRKQGIGHLLMKETIKIAKEKGMQCLRLEVNNHNHKALMFYNKFGFMTYYPTDRLLGESIFLEKIIAE